jgi:rhodanese-related sulfurtransferase
MATLTKTAITVAELDEMMERGDSFLLLDVRNQDEFERWKIEGRNPLETVHIPYFQFIEDEDRSVDRVPKGKLVVAVCAKGGSSDYVAGVLRQRGYEAVNLEGGMIAWGQLLPRAAYRGGQGCRAVPDYSRGARRPRLRRREQRRGHPD